MAGSTPRARKARRRFTPMNICRRGVLERRPVCVVPANAGTHNHRPEWLEKGSTDVPGHNLLLMLPRFCRDALLSWSCRMIPTSKVFGAALRSAHLRVVADRGAAVTPGIQLSGVSKTYRSRDGDVPSLRPLDFHIN